MSSSRAPKPPQAVAPRATRRPQGTQSARLKSTGRKIRHSLRAIQEMQHKQSEAVRQAVEASSVPPSPRRHTYSTSETRRPKGSTLSERLRQSSGVMKEKDDMIRLLQEKLASRDRKLASLGGGGRASPRPPMEMPVVTKNQASFMFTSAKALQQSESKLKAMREQLDEAKSAESRYRDELRSLQKHLAGKNQEEDSLNEHLRATEAQLHDVKAQLAACFTELSGCQAEKEGLDKAAQQLTRTNLELKDTAAELKRRWAEAAAELRASQDGAVTTERAWRRRLEALQLRLLKASTASDSGSRDGDAGEVSSLKQQLVVLRAAASQHAKELATASAKAAVLSTQLQDARATITETSARASNWEKRALATESSAAVLATTKELLLKRNRRITKLKLQVEEEIVRRTAAERRIENLECSEAKLNAALADACAASRSEAAQREREQQEAQDAAQAIRSSQEMLAALNAELTACRSQKKAVEAAACAQVEQHADLLRIATAELEQRVAETQKRLDDALGELAISSQRERHLCAELEMLKEQFDGSQRRAEEAAAAAAADEQAALVSAEQLAMLRGEADTWAVQRQAWKGERECWEGERKCWDQERADWAAERKSFKLRLAESRGLAHAEAREELMNAERQARLAMDDAEAARLAAAEALREANAAAAALAQSEQRAFDSEERARVAELRLLEAQRAAMNVESAMRTAQQAEQAAADARVERSAAQNQVSELEQMLVEAEAGAADAINEGRRCATALQQRVDELLAQLSTAQQRLQFAEAKEQDAQKQLADARSLGDGAVREADRLRTELQQARASAKALRREIAASASAVASAQAKLAAANARSEEAERMCSSAQKRAQQLTRANEKVQSVLGSQQREGTVLATEVETLRERLAAVEKRSERSEECASAAERSLAKFRAHAAQIKETLANASALARSISEISSEVESCVSAEAKASGEVTSLKLLVKEAEVSTMEKRVDLMRKEIRSSNQTIGILVYNVSACEKQIAKWDPAAAAKQNAARTTQLKSLERKLEEEAEKQRRFEGSNATNVERLQTLQEKARNRLVGSRDNRKALIQALLGQVSELVGAVQTPADVVRDKTSRSSPRLLGSKVPGDGRARALSGTRNK